MVYDKANAVKGIATRDMGIDKEGAPKDSFERHGTKMYMCIAANLTRKSWGDGQD